MSIWSRCASAVTARKSVQADRCECLLECRVDALRLDPNHSPPASDKANHRRPFQALYPCHQ